MISRTTIARTSIPLFLLPCLLVWIGCDRNNSKPDTVVLQPLATLSSAQQIQKEQAIAAKDQMFKELVDELMKSLTTDGPARAIRVCKTRAPEIATAVSRERGLQIGRTSFQLRNQDNQPPGWATKFVKQRLEKPVEVALPNEGLGVLLPIKLQTTCIMCHGNDNQILPEVKAAIVSNYADDTATGFSEGDLRGYFWVEVPAASARRP